MSQNMPKDRPDDVRLEPVAVSVQQAEGIRRGAEAASGVDAGGQPIGDVGCGEFFADAGDFAKRMNSRALLSREDFQAMFDKNSVLIEERNDVSNSPKCNKIKTLTQIRVLSAKAVFTTVLQKGVADFESDTDAGKLLYFNRGARQFGIDDGICVQWLDAWRMVIRDD